MKEIIKWAHPGLSKRRRVIEKILDILAWGNFFYGIGESLTGLVTSFILKFFYLGGSAIVLQKLFHIDITTTVLKILIPAWLIFDVIIGYVQWKKGFYMRQQEIGARQGNPFWAKVEKDIESIKNKLGI